MHMKLGGIVGDRDDLGIAYIYLIILLYRPAA